MFSFIILMRGNENRRKMYADKASDVPQVTMAALQAATMGHSPAKPAKEAPKRIAEYNPMLTKV